MQIIPNKEVFYALSANFYRYEERDIHSTRKNET